MGSIRLAVPEDMPRIEEIYRVAQQFMVRMGNPHQWEPGFPGRAQIGRDIEAGALHVFVEGEGTPAGCFAYLSGPEPDYAEIFEGSWPDDAPYDVVHRFATARQGAGIGSAMLEWALSEAASSRKPLRIDTHRDNLPMQRLILGHGFAYCGIIHLARNGDERLAYAHPRKA